MNDGIFLLPFVIHFGNDSLARPHHVDRKVDLEQIKLNLRLNVKRRNKKKTFIIHNNTVITKQVWLSSKQYVTLLNQHLKQNGIY
jgi:hypothetical protein